jgi:DNA-binding SARP family transcriptional activator
VIRPRRGSPSSKTYLSHLRTAIGRDLIRTHASGYSIELGTHQLDLHRFERLLEAARELEPERAAPVLREALALWHGTPLADLAFEALAQPEIARLEELRFVALEWRIEAGLALGHHEQLIGELEGLVSKYPVRERLRGLLMLALYRAGRQADALEAYQAARAPLVDELGIEPSQPLQELERATCATTRRWRSPERQPPEPARWKTRRRRASGRFSS